MEKRAWGSRGSLLYAQTQARAVLVCEETLSPSIAAAGPGTTLCREIGGIVGLKEGNRRAIEEDLSPGA